MATFVCPRCRREVVADADLEGRSADCARCGAPVDPWPAPVRRTRKPRTTLGNAYGCALWVAFVALAALVVFGLVRR